MTQLLVKIVRQDCPTGWDDSTQKGCPEPEASTGAILTHTTTSFHARRSGETPNGASPHCRLLLLVNEMATAILLPASFVAFGAEWFFFAVADRLDPAGVDTGRGESALHGTGTRIAQSQIVIGGTALVAVSFNRNVYVWMLIEELRVGLDRALLVPAKIRLVIVEVNILHILAEQVFVRDRRRWRRWRRGAGVTVSRAVASCEPPGPLATR